MSLPPALLRARGAWTGHNHLYLPGEPVRHSAAAATIETVVSGKFVTIDYSWHFDDLAQEGLLLLGQNDAEDGRFVASWADSWHMNDDLMPLQGRAEEDDAIVLWGEYAAGDGPAWGWRIDLRAADSDNFELLMFNVTPAGEEMLAVEMTLGRRPLP